jgi:hypothetical protein
MQRSDSRVIIRPQDARAPKESFSSLGPPLGAQNSALSQYDGVAGLAAGL